MSLVSGPGREAGRILLRPGLAFVLMWLALPALASAADIAPASAEIEYLLASIGSSACDFNRNGSWYDAVRAEKHLRLKYRTLLASRTSLTAEEFIGEAATRSSISGVEYQIRCKGNDPTPSAEWLTKQLTLYRHRWASSTRRY